MRVSNGILATMLALGAITWLALPEQETRRGDVLQVAATYAPDPLIASPPSPVSTCATYDMGVWSPAGDPHGYHVFSRTEPVVTTASIVDCSIAR